ncbi:threonine-phosphate decarboxylase CobD [Pseudaestuariivita atlantica]|uniref:threonine-phosphate decarboxylase n=1 Tax=Pseudaestuariivita atlantica TaxID=1317121 RepID=A0A0L1JQK8_9RHOB|nr:threonine-phosphate decarboxylase CobD [Pseudaestuariivita atlantica]KNG94015.1 alpha-ribazole phosphatase [Pseudaestuariivita atlantica]
MRDHGGNLDAARAAFGGAAGEWIDLSTGINRVPYPVGDAPRGAWTDLPGDMAMQALTDAARAAYATEAPILPLAGATQPIQLIPRLLPRGEMRILAPTYNEHAASARAAGWEVREVADPAALAGAALAVIVNPNNPDGRAFATAGLRALANEVGHLVVDESFVDPTPEASLCPMLDALDNVVVLRSFGKFYGLAGLRLGFALGPARLLMAMREEAGPWAVSGPALAIGARALADIAWADATRARLGAETTRLDTAADRAGWRTVGGTALFRLYDTGDARAAQEKLARARIWSRVFPYSDTWLRLGLPGGGDEWDRVEAALGA